MPNASAKAESSSPSFEHLVSVAKVLPVRAKIASLLRAAFEAAHFIEVETPVGILAPAAEEYIEAPRSEGFFLRTSPELQMKRLLAAGMERIYQLGPCFRMGENGRRHRSEFTLLEFYQAGAGYRELLDFTQSFLLSVCRGLHGDSSFSFNGQKISLEKLEIIPVREAFRRFAGRDADQCAEEDSLFERVLVEKVEPSLPKDRPCVLIDYPVRFGAFARPKASDPTLAERWEMYLGGIELANTYGELIDPAVQRERFRRFAETRRKMKLTEYPEPSAFLEAIDRGIPECAGSALGFDRLVMLLSDHTDIAEISFPLDS
ncbi:MAG: Elongation factor P--(R)-beta-lysine ligase [Lentisphaerae bacterium ADurb.Bin242]|nr:MAG: Elongation factor P--(R)-beta-lysine ligase [Lentisphaerae bacterium ADurb.Bin242]